MDTEKLEILLRQHRDFAGDFETNVPVWSELAVQIIVEWVLDESGWQPIETAPKDGRPLVVGRWSWLPSEEKPTWCSEVVPAGDTGAATHWMPLPEPPNLWGEPSNDF